MTPVQHIHTASPAHMPGLKTFRALPIHGMNQIDPFIFLNHHGPDEFPPANRGLPFGPHPHRGFETLTFVINGEVLHADSTGGESVIKAGGVQWMTAGKGIVHKEISSDEFKRVGGSLEILQLWMNLPAHKKMVEPAYQGLQKDEIPVVPFNGGNIQAIAGYWNGVEGGIRSITNHKIGLIHFNGKAELTLNWEAKRSLFLYVVKGAVLVNGEKINSLQFPEFSEGSGLITVTSDEPAILIYAEGTPINEPMVSHGPFVMNTEQEINQAVRDYQSGKMGVLR